MTRSPLFWAVLALSLVAWVQGAAALNYSANISHSWSFNDTVGVVPPKVFDYVTRTNYTTSCPNCPITSTVPDVFINGTPNPTSYLLNGAPTTTGYFPYGGRYFPEVANKKVLNFTIELWYRYAHGHNDSVFRQKNTSIWGQYDLTSNDPAAGGILLLRSYYGENVRYCFSYVVPSGTGATFMHDFLLCTTNDSQTNSGTASDTGAGTGGINNTWQHLAVTMTSGDGAAGIGSATLIMNGSNISYVPFATQLVDTNFTRGSTSVMYFGITFVGGGTGTYVPMAFFDEVRVWNVSRTAENISRLMNQSLPSGTGASSPPIATNIVNMSFVVYDEDSAKPLTNVSVNQSGELYAIIFDTTYRRNLTINPFNASFELDNVSEGRYEVTTGPLQDIGYLRRMRIFFANNSNYTIVEKLFLVNTTVAPNFVAVTLLDETNRPIANYTIQSQRRFVLDDWLPVEDAITDQEGQATMSFHLNTVMYRFQIRRNNTNDVMIDPITIRGNTLVLTINRLDDPLQAFRRMGLAQPQVSCSNASGNLSVIYEDSSHVMDYSVLTAARFTSADRSTVCSYNSSQNPVWFNCTLPNESGTTFNVRYCIHWPNATGSGLEDECYSQECVVGNHQTWGQLGALVGVVMMAVGFILGIIAGGVMGGLFGVFLASLGVAVSHIWVWGYGVSAAFLVLIGIVQLWGKT